MFLICDDDKVKISANYFFNSTLLTFFRVLIACDFIAMQMVLSMLSIGYQVRKKRSTKAILEPEEEQRFLEEFFPAAMDPHRYISHLNSIFLFFGNRCRICNLEMNNFENKFLQWRNPRE
tara:strand:- start:357 stop:716 length:360 start_codon:yes stop_codon:yes gene_type:complete